MLLRADLSGAGIGMLPTYLLGDELRAGPLVPLMTDHELEMLGIHAIYLSHQYQPLAIRLLADFLAARFGAGGVGALGSSAQIFNEGVKQILVSSAEQLFNL